MRTIIRCPSCFTYVYSDARRCHGCGQKIGKRKLLTRGSWVFIVLAVVGFTIARGIDLHQENRNRIHRQLQLAKETETTKSFVRSWLSASREEIAASFSSRKAFGADLLALRDKYPNDLPATSVVGITVHDRGWESHMQAGKGPVAHEEEEWSPRLRASSSNSASSTFSDFRGRSVHRQWTSPAYDFEAEFRKDDRSYTIYGRVCIEDTTIFCLAIDRIEGVEGPVKPKG